MQTQTIPPNIERIYKELMKPQPISPLEKVKLDHECIHLCIRHKEYKIWPFLDTKIGQAIKTVLAWWVLSKKAIKKYRSRLGYFGLAAVIVLGLCMISYWLG